jgi:hypothetical protein
MDNYDPLPRENEMINSKLQGDAIQQLKDLTILADGDKVGLNSQLDLDKHLQTLNYLLRGYIKTIGEKGAIKWVAPKSDDMIVFAPYGVQLIMNTIEFYLNQNTLLSNFEDSVILQKMKGFSTALNDCIFTQSDQVFLYPTLDECFNVLDKRISEKSKLKQYALKLVGEDVEIEVLKNEYLREIEGSIEKEIDKIKEQLMKNKYKRFELLMRVIQDSVHSTYLRAWKGQERKTLRQNNHVIYNESANEHNNVKQDQGFFSRKR